MSGRAFPVAEPPLPLLARQLPLAPLRKSEDVTLTDLILRAREET